MLMSFRSSPPSPPKKRTLPCNIGKTMQTPSTFKHRPTSRAPRSRFPPLCAPLPPPLQDGERRRRAHERFTEWKLEVRGSGPDRVRTAETSGPEEGRMVKGAGGVGVWGWSRILIRKEHVSGTCPEHL